MFLVAVTIFILGLAWGSFFNVVIFRLKKRQSFLAGRSFCPRCFKILRWYDNIPVLSFIILKARCRFCRKRISWQYPLVELATAIIFTLGYLKFGVGLKLLSFIVFSSFLTIIFVYDLRYYLILDKVSVPAMTAALLFNLFLGFKFWELILGAVIIAGFFWLQFVLSKGRWIGGGDIRLGAVMGLMLGWKLGLVALFLAYMMGAVVAIILVTTKKKKFGSQIPFGTFLSLATVITLLYGQKILAWYLEKLIIY